MTNNFSKFSDDSIDFGYTDFPYMSTPLPGAASPDKLVFPDTWGNEPDAVNSPAHYTRGSQEAIEIIEEAIQDAPEVKAGMLQAQVLKYLLRVWLKDNPKEDLQKARWYLTRLIDSL